MPGLGELRLTVWPAYVAFGNGPQLLPVDRRAQIQWRSDNGSLTGVAEVLVPKGEYMHQLYYHTPDGPPSFVVPFTHPYIQAGTGMVTATITNGAEVFGHKDTAELQLGVI